MYGKRPKRLSDSTQFARSMRSRELGGRYGGRFGVNRVRETARKRMFLGKRGDVLFLLKKKGLPLYILLGPGGLT